MSEFLRYPSIISKSVANNNLIITEHTISAAELMRILIQPIRLYSKQDNSVLYVLLKSLQFIKNNPHISNENKAVIKTELDALKYDINENINNKLDKEKLMELFENNRS